VKRLPAGARLSYGLRYTMPSAGTVATVPIGYADGVPRALSATGGEVLVRGRRHPIAGTVTMDQLMVDVGDGPVEVGDEVVVTYESRKTDGSRFRNTEVLTFEGDKIRRAEVYFGWDVE
jgi:alanine racemase